MTPSNSFAELLRQFRLEAGLTQEELAERSFVSAKSIGSLERDPSRLPRLETVRVIAEALELDEIRRERFITAARPAVRSIAEPSAPSQALPAPSTPLFGRDGDVDLVRRLLTEAFEGSGPRMIVITGPGGVGKTRLALAAIEREPAGAAVARLFVDLAPMNDPGLVVDAIARQMGATDRESISSRDWIAAVVRQQPTLVLLDNAEHLVDARTELAALTDHCPQLVLLVTSRVPMALRSERRVRLRPLPVPPPEAAISELVRSPALNLFIDRARSVGWDTDSTHELSTIAQICQRLDGLPLAIELAAAWMNLFTPGELLERLDQRLPLLTRGRHDMPERQRTMHSAIGWSYDLLDTSLQASFRRLCIFENGAAISTIRAFFDNEDEQLTVDLILAELADQSLIGWHRDSAERDRESELRILQTIQEFGLEQLRQEGELSGVARSHADVMVGLVEKHSSALGGPDEPIAIDHLDRAYDNIRAALDHCLNEVESGKYLRFVGMLWRYWLLRGLLVEGIARLQSAIALAVESEQESPSESTRALTGLAMLLIERGDLETAGVVVDRAVAGARSSSPSDLAATTYAAGLLAAQRGDNIRASEMLREAVALARESPDTYTEVGALGALSSVLFQTGDMPGAAMIEQERLQRCRALGDRRGVALSSKNLAFQAMYSGRFEDAIRLGTESVAELRALGDAGNLAEVLWALGHIAYLQGELDIAAARLSESRAMRLARGDELNAAKSSGALAVVELALGNGARARMLLEEADVPLRAQDDRFGLAMNSIVRGHIELADGNDSAAEELLSEGGKLMEEMGNFLYLSWQLEGMAVLAAGRKDWAGAARHFGVYDDVTTQAKLVLPLLGPESFERARAATFESIGEHACGKE